MNKRLFSLGLLLISVSSFAARSDIVTLYGSGTNSNTPAFRIDANGNLFEALLNSTNVGIGTSSPSRMLELYKSGGGSPTIRYNDGTSYWDLRSNGTVGSSFQLDYNNDPRLLMTHDGNLGISTTVPTALLDVNGSAHFGGIVRFSSAPWIDITAPPYNAVGNGTTDNTNAIQAAINAGTNIHIPCGTFVVSDTLSVNYSSTTIFGDGPCSVIKEIVSGSNYITLAAADKTGLTFKNFTIDAGSTTYDVAGRGGIECAGTNFGCRNTLIENITILNRQAVGIGLERCSNTTVRNCYIYRTYEHGIYMSGTDGAGGNLIVGNNIVEAGYNSLTSHLSIKLYQSSGTTIIGNNIINPYNRAINFELDCKGTSVLNNYIYSSNSHADALINVTAGTTALGEISHNYIESTSSTTTPIRINAGTRHRIIGNEIYISSAAPLPAIDCDTNYALQESIIADNYIHSASGGSGTAINLRSTATLNVIDNNIIEGFSAGTGISFGASTSSNSARGNMYSNVGTPVSDSGIGNMWSVNNSTYVLTYGNVGVGTSNPTTKLYVSGDITGSTITASNALLATGTGLTGTNPIFKVGGGTLTVTASGKVGINTTNPTKGFVNEGNDALFGNVTSGDYLDLGSLGDTNGWLDALGADTSVGMRFRVKGTASTYVFKTTAQDILTINNGGSMVYVSSGITIPDDGAGTSPAYTLTPTSSHVEITCSDGNGCTVTLGESGITQGQWLTVLNIGANTVTFADSAGVSETAGAFAAGQYDSITYDYMADRWIERCRSNN